MRAAGRADSHRRGCRPHPCRRSRRSAKRTGRDRAAWSAPRTHRPRRPALDRLHAALELCHVAVHVRAVEDSCRPCGTQWWGSACVDHV